VFDKTGKKWKLQERKGQTVGTSQPESKYRLSKVHENEELRSAFGTRGNKNESLWQ
jgi:hypothetical protein